MSRKLVVLLFVIVLSVSLIAVVGCGSNSEETKNKGTTVEETTPIETTPAVVETAPQTQPQTIPATQPQPVVTPAPTPEATSAEPMVVVTRTGEKYHVAGCRYVVNKTDTRTIPLSQAKSEGYTPCSVCNPPQ